MLFFFALTLVSLLKYASEKTRKQGLPLDQKNGDLGNSETGIGE
jgi:hypothetical protein